MVTLVTCLSCRRFSFAWLYSGLGVFGLRYDLTIQPQPRESGVNACSPHAPVTRFPGCGGAASRPPPPARPPRPPPCAAPACAPPPPCAYIPTVKLARARTATTILRAVMKPPDKPVEIKSFRLEI